MNDTSPSRIDIARTESAQGAILFDRDRIAQADATLLRPETWTGAKEQRGEGGRGAVWRVQGEFGQGVLRHYRRGGLIGRVNRDRYFWHGEEATRSFHEFRLLATLREQGLPVPAPLAAGYTRQGPFYRADLLTALIPAAHTLAQRLRGGFPSAELWHRIGALLARFHAAGVYHADLNAHNLMIDVDNELWLIDFDRGELRAPTAAWQQQNLQRLRRSLRKLGAEAAPEWNEAWLHLEGGYRAGTSA